MRPVSNFLIMQLSNSRATSTGLQVCLQAAPWNRICRKALLTKKKDRDKIPSLTVEKKNECHNP